MYLALHTLAVLFIAACLAVFSYLDRIYRELGRVTTGRVHEHLDIFEAEIEPKIGLPRKRAALGFSLLARLWLVLIAVETARGVVFFVPERLTAFAEMVVFLTVEVIVAMHFLPDLWLARTTGRWLRPLVPILRAVLILMWPLRVVIETGAALTRISDEEVMPGSEDKRNDQEGLEALVEAAQEEGILEKDEAELIEQVVEFSDKRVTAVMTPRPDMVVIAADASLEDLRNLIVEKKFSRVPVYGENLDDIVGIAFARDLLEVADLESATRKVREITRPATFVPESKRGSDLLKELQRSNQQMAIAVDEHGLIAGLVTIEDLVEEIVGEIGEEDRRPAPDVVRENDGSLTLRGSLSLDRLNELFGMEFSPEEAESATTLAGLLNHVAGHVPAAGEKVDFDGVSFTVLEANQRKVLRLRARRHGAVMPVSRR
jgi:putative hemolysin